MVHYEEIWRKGGGGGEREEGKKERNKLALYTEVDDANDAADEAHRSIEAVTVVVQLALFLQKIELNPVVETRNLSTLDLS